MMTDTFGERETDYQRVQSSEEFQALRRRFRRFVFPMTAAFFLVWIWLSARLRKASFSQDVDGDVRWTYKNRMTAAMGLPLGALTLTFAAIYWVKSLEYHWFSTMYGVWFFANCVRGAKVANLQDAPTETYVRLVSGCERFAPAARGECYRWLGKVLAVLTPRTAQEPGNVPAGLAGELGSLPSGAAGHRSRTEVPGCRFLAAARISLGERRGDRAVSAPGYRRDTAARRVGP